MTTADKPFLDEVTPETAKITKGTKLDNQRSMFAKKNSDKVSFEESADKYVGELKDRNKRAFDLAKQFMDVMKDKTLPENKSVIVQDIEREVKNKLLQLSIEINNDENEENDGMGSLAIISLLLKTVMLQRDSINLLEYKLKTLEKKMSSGPAEKPSNV